MADNIRQGPTPGAKLVHDMRNCLSMMQLTVRTLSTSWNNELEIKSAQSSLAEEIAALQMLITKADAMLMTTEGATPDVRME